MLLSDAFDRSGARAAQAGELEGYSHLVGEKVGLDCKSRPSGECVETEGSRRSPPHPSDLLRRPKRQ